MKNSAAVSTLIASTSAMLLSRSFTSSVFSLKRDPWQVGHGLYTLGRNSNSTETKPSPEQVSQRPFATLKEKRPASYLRDRASFVAANRRRTSSKRPV